MGQGPSVSNNNSALGGGAKRRSRVPSLIRSGRYMELTSPSAPNAKIHVIGVFPCSSLSAEEAEDLINEVKPDMVYLSLHPEMVGVLERDVKANKFLDAGWKIPENSPSFERYDGAGWLVSMNIRNVLADNEMLGLLGAEAFLPYKAALRASQALSSPPKILSFPLTMQYNNGETLDQPAHFNTMLVGNASTGSMQVTALVGNPNSWFFLDQVLQDQQAAEAAAKANVNNSSSSSPPISSSSTNVRKPDVEFSATIPESTGYFTRAGVLQLQNDFRSLVNTACMKASSASADVEADLLLREAAAREAGKPDIATTMSQRAMISQRISQAAAYHIQEAIEKKVNEDIAAGIQIDQAEKTTSISSSSSSSAVKSKRPLTAVAVVNIGQLASFSRNWNEGRPPTELFPPLSTFQHVIGNALPVSVSFLTIYGLYRGFKRFPRITTAFTVTAGLSTGAVVYSALNGDWTRYGSFVRSALARPRVVSPIMKINR